MEVSIVADVAFAARCPSRTDGVPLRATDELYSYIPQKSSSRSGVRHEQCAEQRNKIQQVAVVRQGTKNNNM